MNVARGRPKGSVSLTDEMEEQIVLLVQSGVPYPHAIKAVGVAERTGREWRERGEGRSTRPPTKKLKRFASRVRAAEALAITDALVRLLQKDPEKWLRYMERYATQEGSGDIRLGLDLTELEDPDARAEAMRVIEQVLLYHPDFVIAHCGDETCNCIFHSERSEE